jgi:peptidyl-prolyl cis-trans isomerase C
MQESRVALFALCALVLIEGCEKISDEKIGKTVQGTQYQNVSRDEVVASVNGVPILAKHLSELIESQDGGLPVDEALDMLVKNELLAQEAERRGIGLMKEVEYAREIELARHALKVQIGRDVNAGTLDVDKLKKLYDANKRRFVHGVMRSVVHIVVLVDDKHFGEKEASSLAQEIAERARETKTKEEFIALGEFFLETYKDKIKIEKLPPFDAESGQFIKEFVQAAFAVPGVGQSSPPVKTKFGWHVIFVWEEQPPESRSFEDVRGELSENVLPIEREMRAKELMEKLEKKGKVFVYEDSLNNYLEQQ